MKIHHLFFAVYSCTHLLACQEKIPTTPIESPDPEQITISKAKYQDQLEGFWLAQCIGNWTGLITEMDKVGNIGEFHTGEFYTRNDWGQPDQPSIWGQGVPSDLSSTIDFVTKDTSEVWGSDDDTDIEYIYQHLLHQHNATRLTPQQIADGWLKHIKHEEENFLWVSNQKALDLMIEGLPPPQTGNPSQNEHHEMIDAQLTTEIFGLFAPGRPDIAVQLAELPIQTTARKNAEWISKFYVHMYSLSASVGTLNAEQIVSMAQAAKTQLPDSSYAAKMFEYVYSCYQQGLPWEAARDSIYERYQVQQADGYDITSQNLYCNGCFAAGINFAASLISLFYGEGDLKNTIKIGTLTGWDSDNPTATWAGMIGANIGRSGVEKAFGKKFSHQFNIHRTRVGFENNGLDDFTSMAKKGLDITENVILNEIGGSLDTTTQTWSIPVQ